MEWRAGGDIKRGTWHHSFRYSSLHNTHTHTHTQTHAHAHTHTHTHAHMTHSWTFTSSTYTRTHACKHTLACFTDDSLAHDHQWCLDLLLLLLHFSHHLQQGVHWRMTILWPGEEVEEGHLKGRLCALQRTVCNEEIQGKQVRIRWDTLWGRSATIISAIVLNFPSCFCCYSPPPPPFFFFPFSSFFFFFSPPPPLFWFSHYPSIC